MRASINSFLWVLLFLIGFQPNTLLAQTWQWVDVNTAPASTNIHSGCTALAVDPAGNAVIAGFFTGTITLGSKSLTSGGSDDDLFIARFTATGVCTQAVAISGSGGVAHIRALAIDQNGGIVIAGDVSGVIQLGSTLDLYSVGAGGFVARMSSAGDWTQAVVVGNYSSINALALDNQGNVVVTGYFRANSAVFGAKTLHGSYLNRSLFVAQLSTAGIWTQAAQAVGTGDSEGSAIALDGSGNLVVAGIFAGAPVTFGATTLPNAGGASGNTGTDIVIARLNTVGTWVQAVAAGGPDDDTANALAVDASGTAVVTGVVQANGKFGTISPLKLYREGYVARLDVNGVWRQATVFPSLSYVPQKLVLGMQGTVWVAGPDGVCKVTAAGNWTAIAGIGSGGNSHTIGGLGQASNGDLFVVGQLGGTALFGTKTVNPDGRYMYFVAHLAGVTLSTRAPDVVNQVSVYPQPAHDKITITGLSGLVQLFNVQGQEVKRFNMLNTSDLHLAGLPAGVYILRSEQIARPILVE